MTPESRGNTCCGYADNHCRWCDQHFVVRVLVTDHERECVARPARSVA